MSRIKWMVCMVVLFAMGIAHASEEDYAGKKVLFIDSYHQGYAWSDGIEAGVRSVLDNTGVELKVTRMDTYRNRGDEYAAQAGERVRDLILEFEPDVVIAADDNASKFVIVPFFKGGELPFTTCGINWTAEQYGFPVENVTGMIEVAPAVELLQHLRPFAKGDRAGYIAMDNPNNRRELAYFGQFLNLEFDQVAWPTTAEEFKTMFLDMQGKVDMIFIDSDGGLFDEETEKDLQAFLAENTKVPTGTCIEFMAPYVMLGFSKMPEEQGEWAAQAALQILAGTPASEIEWVVNTKGSLTINGRIVEALGVLIPHELLELATRVIE